LNFIQHRARLHRHDYFHPIAFRLTENADVLDLPGIIKGADVVLGHSIRVGQSDLRSHLSQYPLAADRGRSSVLDIDRPNDWRSLTRDIRRRLRPRDQCDCGREKDGKGNPSPTAA
jgi:hypothetical protein